MESIGIEAKSFHNLSTEIADFPMFRWISSSDGSLFAHSPAEKTI